MLRLEHEIRKILLGVVITGQGVKISEKGILKADSRDIYLSTLKEAKKDTGRFRWKGRLEDLAVVPNWSC